jgi:hypothetical protein
MIEESMGPYRFTLRPRLTEIGGGWRFRAYETMPGGEEVEVSGGIFPTVGNPIRPGDPVSEYVPARPTPPDTDDPAYALALAAAHEWLATMPRPEHRDGEHYMLGCFARDAAARLGD